MVALDERRNREGAIKRTSGMGCGIRGLRWGYFCLPCLAMVLSSSLPALSQNQQPGLSQEPGTGTSAPAASAPGASTSDQQPDEQLSGSINGTVLDGSGTAVIGARVQLTRDERSQDPAQNRAQIRPESGDAIQLRWNVLLRRRCPGHFPIDRRLGGVRNASCYPELYIRERLKISRRSH